MHFSTLATVAVLAGNVFAWDTTTSTSYPTTTSASDTCYTITEYNKPPCTIPSPCTTDDCITLSTITQSCGCSTIPTTDICLTYCPGGCGVEYKTIYIPCPTSPSSPSSSSTYPTYPTSSSSSSSPTTGPVYTNSTVTVTSITTLTTCPATCTCSGQKTTWTGSSGPYSCTKVPSCVAQLPGGGTTTITGTTVVSKTGPTPTTSTGPTQIGVSDGKKRSEVGNGGLLAGLIGLVAML